MYKILKAEQLTANIFLMDVEAPRVARHCEPGQFVIVKMDEKGERIPLTICDAMRLASALRKECPCRSKKPYLDTIIIKAEPSATIRCVRIPASFNRLRRSIPIIKPQIPAKKIRRTYPICTIILSTLISPSL